MLDSQQRRKEQLKLTVDKLLSGDARQHGVIRTEISRYVYHQRPHPRIDPDDIVSDTLLILLKNLRSGKFRGDSLTALSAYVYQIVRFRICKTWHSLKHEFPTSDMPDVPGPDEELLHQHREVVEKLFAALGENCRKILSLKFLKGWQNQEIADECGKTKNALSTALYRCIRKARELDFVQKML